MLSVFFHRTSEYFIVKTFSLNDYSNYQTVIYVNTLQLCFFNEIYCILSLQRDRRRLCQRQQDLFIRRCWWCLPDDRLLPSAASSRRLLSESRCRSSGAMKNLLLIFLKGSSFRRSLFKDPCSEISLFYLLMMLLHHSGFTAWVKQHSRPAGCKYAAGGKKFNQVPATSLTHTHHQSWTWPRPEYLPTLKR